MNKAEKVFKNYLKKIKEVSKTNEFFEKFVIKSFFKIFPERKSSEKNIQKWINNLLLYLASNSKETIYDGKNIKINNKRSLLSAVKILIKDFNADVNAKDNSGMTPLLWATIKGNLRIVNLLIKHEADVNEKEPANKDEDMFGNNALLYAAEYNKLNIAEVLLKYGADVNATDIDKQTPLIRATIRKHKKMVELLLRYGADASIIDQDGDTAKTLAEESGEEDIINII